MLSVKVSSVNFYRQSQQWLTTNFWQVLMVVAIGCGGLASGLWASGVILDDALITFRVAENLAYGQGFVYNVGERIQVTTTPLYAMILAIGTWFFGSALRASLVFNLTFATLIPILAYQIGRRIAGWVTGLSAALLLMVAPLLIIAFSMESYLYVALILASFFAYSQPYYLRWTGILVGLTVLVRGDGILLGACLLTYDFLAQRRLRWPLIIPAIGLPLLWFIFAILYYGSPFPATLGAKVAQGEFDWLGQNFLDGLLFYLDTWIRGKDFDAFYLFVPLTLLGIGATLWRERLWLILLGRDVLYFAAFVYLAVPAAEWYYAPLMPGIALLTGRGLQVIADGVVSGLKKLAHARRLSPSPYLWQSITIGILLLFITPLLQVLFLTSRDIIRQNPDWKAQVYPPVARWIAKNTSSEANFATIDIGHLGYWSKRPIIDIVGLAQPDVAAKIAEGDFSYAIQTYQPDMVLLGFSWLSEVQITPWFQDRYAPRHFFRFGNTHEPLVLFSRREGIKVHNNPTPLTTVTPLSIDFNQQIHLTGYELNDNLSPGTPLNLTLFWQVMTPLEVDFTVFVQVLDGNNNIVAQRDSKPQNGFYPTVYWQPDETVIDEHILLLPNNLAAGSYEISIGLYELNSGHRLQILDNTGQFQSDHIRLSPINVTAP